MTRGMVCDLLGLRLGGLELWLDARDSGLPLALPDCHEPFRLEGAPAGGLRLRVLDGPARSTEGWQSLFFDEGSWQLWRDPDGRRVFVPPGYLQPPRQIAVDSAFRSGEVVGEFGAGLPEGQAVYPLQDMDMRLVANWLADTGDLILHAAGIDDEGAGYAFVGPSGAGKSTLIGELASLSRATVLGEDQVIVRWQDGRFVVYGTPWHTDPRHCSPGGGALRKLFFLDRTMGHGVEPCGPRAGIERLLPEALIPYYNRAGLERILDTLARLAKQVPFYTLGFQLGAEVMTLIREA